jgi:hypothetical protein
LVVLLRCLRGFNRFANQLPDNPSRPALPNFGYFFVCLFVSGVNLKVRGSAGLPTQIPVNVPRNWRIP